MSRLGRARAVPAVGERAPLLLHVFPSFAAGGAQMRFVALANHFGTSFRHAVIALDGDTSAKNRLAPELRVCFPDMAAGGGTLRRVARYRAVLARLGPDMLISSNWGAIEWALANLLPLVGHIHTEDGFGADERDRQLPRRVWTRRLALRRSLVIVPSQKLFRIATETWRLPRGRVRYVPNGIDLVRFAPPRSRPRPIQPSIIGCVAALRPEKNLARLLRAARRLRDTAAFRVVIVGDGPERGALTALAAELGLAVEFLGEVADPAPLYRSFDLFALSSDTEQMPLSVLEAMASGLAIAATDVGDIKTMVAPGNRPFVSGRGEVELAGSIGLLLGSPERRVEIGAANRARAERQFDALSMYERYRHLYEGTEERERDPRPGPFPEEAEEEGG